MKRILLLSFWVILQFVSNAQLKPGFNPDEYTDLLHIADQTNASEAWPDRLAAPKGYQLLYRSKAGPLDNLWELWKKEDGVLICSIRGTTSAPKSWMENFYSAMIPAKGSLALNDSTSFSYHFANTEGATVHVGWSIGASTLLPDILQQLEPYRSNPNLQLIITGHSQGGAIAYLVSQHLASVLGPNATIKTYCSAPPKPGNDVFCADFDHRNRYGWAFRVINSADWVPASPLSIQLMTDLPPNNPLSDVNALLAKQSGVVKMAGKMAYKQLTKHPKKAVKKYEKYLGNWVYKEIRKSMPQLKEPVYSGNMQYLPAGSTIALVPSPNYYRQFPATDPNKFMHHSAKAYLFLLNEAFPKN